MGPLNEAETDSPRSSRCGKTSSPCGFLGAALAFELWQQRLGLARKMPLESFHGKGLRAL
jgi:hypothetical protein